MASIAAKKRRAVVRAAKAKADVAPADGAAPGAAIPQRKRGLSLVLDHPAHGRVEIRHHLDSGGAPLCLSRFSSVELPELPESAEGPPVWIQLAKVGHFVKEGRHFDLTPEVFEQISRNFRATQNRAVRVDYEHESTDGKPPPGGWPAKGWIKELDNRGINGLWGLVEWLEPARSQIRAKQYKFISPAIWFNARDRHTGTPIGAWLDSAGITNDPFLDGMVPLAAKASGLSVYSQAMRPALCQALGLSQLASNAECKTELGRLRDFYGAAADAGGNAYGTHEGVDLGVYTNALMSLGSVPMGSTVDDLLDLVEAMIDAHLAEHNLERHDGAEMTSDDEEDSEEFTNMKPNETTNTSAAAPSALSANASTSNQSADVAPVVALTHSHAAAPSVGVNADDFAKFTAKVELQMAELKARNEKLETDLAAERAQKEALSAEAEIEDLITCRQIAPANRKMALAYLKADPEEFRKEYPKQEIKPEHRHVFTQRSTGRASTADQAKFHAKVQELIKCGASAEEAANQAAIELQASNAPIDADALVAKYVKEGHDRMTACVKAQDEIHALRLRRANGAMG